MFYFLKRKSLNLFVSKGTMEDGSCKKDSKMDANGTSDFPTKGFLMTRFKSPHADTVSTKHMGFLKNLHDFYELIVKGDKPLWLLEFGGGPSLYTLISAAKHVDKIVFAEYAESNRREVEMWVEGKTGSKFGYLHPLTPLCLAFLYSRTLFRFLLHINLV